jgi:hypothetical protein
MHSERREVNARQPDNPRCHGLAKGDAPREGKVDGQLHLPNLSEYILRTAYFVLKRDCFLLRLEIRNTKYAVGKNDLKIKREKRP